MSTWGTGPFEEDTAMDFFDELDSCDPKARGERLKTAILRVSRATGPIGFEEATHAVVAASLLAGMMPDPGQEARESTPQAGLSEELAVEALTAVERAHSPGSELNENRIGLGDYRQAWNALAPVLRTLRAIGEPSQDSLF